jgi:hypothetical protein
LTRFRELLEDLWRFKKNLIDLCFIQESLESRQKFQKASLLSLNIPHQVH